MYTVNGTHPNVALNDYVLADGDVIICHYTDDYTKEEGSDKWDGPGGSSGGAGETTITPAVTASGGVASVSLSLTDIKDAIVGAKTSVNP
jgi:hypothetical protein